MSTIITVTTKRPTPFPERDAMHYCRNCERCTQMRWLLAALELDRPELADADRYLEAEIDTEELDCDCEHTTATCEYYDPEQHDDQECGTCNYQDEDSWQNR